MLRSIAISTYTRAKFRTSGAASGARYLHTDYPVIPDSFAPSANPRPTGQVPARHPTIRAQHSHVQEVSKGQLDAHLPLDTLVHMAQELKYLQTGVVSALALVKQQSVAAGVMHTFLRV